MPDNYDSWVSKVNAYTGEKIGVNIEMEVIPWGSWDDRRNIIISTNEPYDIIFGTGKNYVPDITLGAYCDITDMIDENMPELNEMMPEKYWTAVKVDGRVYGVPTYKDNAISNYAVWDKELVEEYNLDISSLVEIDSLTETFETLKADKNDYPVYVKRNHQSGCGDTDRSPCLQYVESCTRMGVCSCYGVGTSDGQGCSGSEIGRYDSVQ